MEGTQVNNIKSHPEMGLDPCVAELVNGPFSSIPCKDDIKYLMERYCCILWNVSPIISDEKEEHHKPMKVAGTLRSLSTIRGIFHSRIVHVI